jgi:hypothetical protein
MKRIQEMEGTSVEERVVQAPCGWTKLFHPKGPQVTIPVLDLTPAGSLACVAAYLDAGWLLQAPGLEEGEEKETVGWVLRGGFERDGQVTPFVLLYAANEQLTWSFLKVYLNKPEDVAAFEFASKMKLNDIPDYIGDNKPQRGAAAKTDKFIIPAPRPFGVVFKKNPKHDSTEEGKMKPARLFVRWVDQRPKEEKPAEKPRVDEETPFDGDSGPVAPIVLLRRDVADLLAKTGRTVGGLATWLQMKNPESVGLGDMTVPQLEACKKKLMEMKAKTKQGAA